MHKIYRPVALVCVLMPLLFVASARAANPVTSSEIAFNYQQMFEPFDSVACTHRADEDQNPYDWVVTCPVRQRARTYHVHLSLAFYPRTIYGVAAYELLYWVTDVTDEKHPVSHSSTVWVHNSTPDNRMKVLEAEQGVENDLAALRLVIQPK